MKTKLRKALDWYIKNQVELVEKYEGKFVVIKDDQLLGIYDNELTAFETTRKEHAPGSFIVKKCEAGRESYVQKFHSRVAFQGAAAA